MSNNRCDKEYEVGAGFHAICGRFAGHIPADAHDLRERNADAEAPFGPWLGVPSERQKLCAVVGCEAEGKPHPCPYDGGFHHHGCIHYDCVASSDDVKRSGLVFRKGSWGLICDAHYNTLTERK